MPARPAAPADAPPADCRLARSAEDLSAHFAIRHAVFVTEQGFFEATDRDGHDADPQTRRVLAWHDGTAAGTVRLYPLDEPGTWKGDRLAVLPPFRRQGVGTPLVRFAAATAARLGGHRMVAHIQPQNITFFCYLGWHQTGGLVSYAGHPHQLMAIELSP